MQPARHHPHQPSPATPAEADQADFNPPPVFIPAVRIPQPDGSVLFRAGRPVIIEASISVREAAQILGLSHRHIEYQCSVGLFKTAYKPGGRPRSRWRISRAEVLDRKLNPAQE